MSHSSGCSWPVGVSAALTCSLPPSFPSSSTHVSFQHHPPRKQQKKRAPRNPLQTYQTLRAFFHSNLAMPQTGNAVLVMTSSGSSGALTRWARCSYLESSSSSHSRATVRLVSHCCGPPGPEQDQPACGRALWSEQRHTWVMLTQAPAAQCMPGSGQMGPQPPCIPGLLGKAWRG